jgi:hypothetical protein
MKKINEQLTKTGINIKTNIAVIQKFPFWKIKVNQTTTTIDIETVRAIYVRIINGK